MTKPEDIAEPDELAEDHASPDGVMDPGIVRTAASTDADTESDSAESDPALDEAAHIPTVDPSPEPLEPVLPEPTPVSAAGLADAAAPPAKKRKKAEGDSWFELVKTVFYAVLIAVGVRTIFFQPFNIPSASMENTLLIGDYLFVSKFSYGYSMYSLPWGYWMRRHIDAPGRILGSDPERGDIIVFKYPPDNKTDYIKRLIGLPGDRIQMKGGVLYINDKPVPKVRVDDYVETDEYGNTHNVPRYQETLPNGKTYYVLDRQPEGGFDDTDVYVVPAGHYFMMGDNRDNSDDSRGHVGMVPYDNLIGRARFIWWSVDASVRLFEPWTWPGAVRYDRLATFVD